jgi:uncharacterized Zn finger protein (UPF0148 family)
MDLRVQLKFCEACGCLWFRSQHETRVYCTPCDDRFKEFPTPQSRKRRGRPRKTTLPTVYAVQAAAQFSSENGTVRNIPISLLASNAAIASTHAALAGGVR